MPEIEKKDFLEKKEGYAVQLSNFEGPLDLLLYLIRKDEIDIYDIPIADITRQYLGYVELMQELDLEVAGEFILMAATLIQIKVRMLLPKPPVEDDEEPEDPRAELVRQILEYKRFKEVAENMGEYESRQSRLFSRRDFQWVKTYQVKEEVSNEELLKDVSLFDLLSAFKQVVDSMPKISTHSVGTIGTTIEEQIEMIRQVLATKDRVSFVEMISTLTNRVQVVVTFMAMLELIKLQFIRIQQAAVFGEIWIVRRSAASE